MVEQPELPLLIQEQKPNQALVELPNLLPKPLLSNHTSDTQQ